VLVVMVIAGLSPAEYGGTVDPATWRYRRGRGQPLAFRRVFVFPSRPYGVAPGFIYIRLGLVCARILSKVLLLALVWRHQFALANWIPPIPIATCLVCLFTAAFLFQAELTNSNFFTPVRVLIGLGAVCVNPVLYRRGRNVLLERNANQPPRGPTLRAEPGRL
jgi:hypothetical protein